ncbi:unnamed protein product, partial [marine sediment metagenome]
DYLWGHGVVDEGMGIPKGTFSPKEVQTSLDILTEVGSDFDMDLMRCLCGYIYRHRFRARGMCRDTLH